MRMSENVTACARRAIYQYIKGIETDKFLRNAHLLGSGAIAGLESKLKQHYGMKYALCVSNATIGLMAIALALGLKNSRFITTPYTYGASIAGFLFLGYEPVFSDIDKDTLTLCPHSARRLINGKTKTILAVDIFGIPSNTNALRKLADDYGLFYVADASQSLGGYRDGKPASYLADALVVSFTTGKSVFAGEGGAVLTNHTDLYEKLVWYMQHPSRQRKELGLHLDNEFGLNGRIHPLGAIWANAILEKSLQSLSTYQEKCFQIISLLNSLGETQPIYFKRDQIVPTFHRVTASWKIKPNPSFVLSKLRRRGFQMSINPSPVRLIYQQASFLAQYGQRYDKQPKCPVAEEISPKRFCLDPSNFRGL